MHLLQPEMRVSLVETNLPTERGRAQHQQSHPACIVSSASIELDKFSVNLAQLLQYEAKEAVAPEKIYQR